MAALFGKDVPKDKTVLIVDIENASVGCALVRLSPNHAPKLFAEKRITLPMLRTVSAERLLKETDKALRQTLLHASTTAARMRNHPKLARVGIISDAYVFIAAPWTKAKIDTSGLSWDIEPMLCKVTEAAIDDTFGTIPVSFEVASSASANATNRLFGQVPDLLLCAIGGEVTELTLLLGGTRTAQATMPLGKHFLLRTLGSHAGVSEQEAHSLLHLARVARTEMPGEEALFSAAKHFAAEFGTASKELVADTPVQGILIIAHEPVGEWAAQNLAANDLSRVFTEGTSVQALHTHHLEGHLAAHAARPDLLFMMEALYIDDQNKW